MCTYIYIYIYIYNIHIYIYIHIGPGWAGGVDLAAHRLAHGGLGTTPEARTLLADTVIQIVMVLRILIIKK